MVNIPIPWMVWVWPLNDWGWFFTIESSETNRPSEYRCCCQKGLTRLVVSRLRSGTRTQFRPMSSWARFRVWVLGPSLKKKGLIMRFIQWNIDSQFSWHMMVAVMKCIISSFFFGTIFFGAKLCFRCFPAFQLGFGCQEFIQGSLRLLSKKAYNVEQLVNIWNAELQGKYLPIWDTWTLIFSNSFAFWNIFLQLNLSQLRPLWGLKQTCTSVSNSVHLPVRIRFTPFHHQSEILDGGHSRRRASQMAFHKLPT